MTKTDKRKMPPKKKVSKSDIIKYYMDFVLENGEQPKSVYLFSKHNKFEESDFYKFFGTFEAIEKEIFKAFFENTTKVLEANKDYLNYEPREKLLSFYYTFFENLTANRSYVVSALKGKGDNLNSLNVLSELRSAFGKYIDELDIETLNLQEENLNKAQNAAIRNAAWLLLLATMKFWMEDNSASFEKTDIFIEKSLNTSFELANTKPIQSVVDLAKFLIKENLNIRT